MSPAGARGRLDVNIKQKSFRATSGGKLQVLGELVFSLGSGEVAALVGPSGCGKTTLLRIVAGLDRDFDGNVAFPTHGTLAMVFQEPRLLPWRTVEQNVRLAAPRVTDAGLEMLDDALAARLREELAELVNRRPVTTLLVTHNVEEAIGLADRLLLLSISPARMLANVPVARPRAAHTAVEMAAIRDEIARRLDQSFSQANL